jgi:Holliday junction DNA helicase RuvA
MIVAIKGKLESSTLFSAVVEAGGLFYEVNIPLTTAERLPKLGEEVMLYTEAVYREDSQALYGFATKSDRDFFKTIIEKVSGIGPKTALNMMSRMSVATLRDSIAMGDVATLSKCPGIGKKTAQKMLLTLKGKLTLYSENEKSSSKVSVWNDVIIALTNMGYDKKNCETVVEKIAKDIDSSLSQSAKEELLFRKAIVELSL